MRKHIKWLIIIVLFSIISFLGFSITKKISHKKEVAARIKTIPNFEFKTLSNIVFNNLNLQQNSFKLFVYYNSECDYCSSETKQISDNIDSFKNTQLLFVSFEEVDSIRAFAKSFKLLNKENVTFLQDSKLEFEELFDAKSIPFMLLYSKENQLIEKYKGATKIDNILKHIN